MRAGTYDYVMVGKFELKEDSVVVDLKKIREYPKVCVNLQTDVR